MLKHFCNEKSPDILKSSPQGCAKKSISFPFAFQCTLPDCFCSVDGTLIPGGMAASDVPQMITITFDDAVNDENWELYQKKLFPPSRKNPNGCPVHATFYVSHEYTNYAMIQKMWNQGHEIAVHSITHR